jgi:hypothetical protein
MIEIVAGLPSHSVGFEMSGKLHDEDYKKFVPLVDAEIAGEGTASARAQLHDFHGGDAGALWDDIKFSTTHYSKIKRVALVGDKTWEKWMAVVCKPFTMAKVRYFAADEIDAARTWLAERSSSTGSESTPWRDRPLSPVLAVGEHLYCLPTRPDSSTTATR